MRITIDRDICTGHGRCWTLVPTLFQPDDEGFGTAIADEVDDAQMADAEKAVANCPEKAITIQ